MVNVNELREAMKRNHTTVSVISKQIGMDDSTFYRKLNDHGKTFTLSQADALAKALNLSAAEAQSIFFCGLLTRVKAS